MAIVFKVKDESYVEVIKEFDDEQEFSGEETETTHVVSGISIVEDNSFNVSGAFTKEQLKESKGFIYLVKAIFSTGDSFNTYHCSNIEYIECFLSEEKAKNLVENIEMHNKIFSTNEKQDIYIKFLEDKGIMEKVKNEKDFNINKFKKNLNNQLFYLNEEDDAIMLPVPWSNYFEVLDYVSFDGLEVEGLMPKSKKNSKLK